MIGEMEHFRKAGIARLHALPEHIVERGKLAEAYALDGAPMTAARVLRDLAAECEAAGSWKNAQLDAMCGSRNGSGQ